MKQIQLISIIKSHTEHGGSISLGKRRKQRPLSLKTPIHLVLRSDFAYGSRSLLRHRPLIEKIIKKAKIRFHIKVYETAIVSNHIHLVIKGHTRRDLQNFFRVVAGHIAQQLLIQFPLLANETKKRGGASKGAVKTREKENKFWQTRLYSRIVSWGRDYLNVKKYVIQNTLEALRLVSYKPRAKKSLAKNLNRKLENTS
jgi:REP element-mobilizing transposase RayT